MIPSENQPLSESIPVGKREVAMAVFKGRRVRLFYSIRELLFLGFRLWRLVETNIGD
jgi:hypothetical protein